MKRAIAGAGVLPGLLIACSPAAEEEPAPTSEPVEEVAQIPAELLGQWYLVRQECEEGADPEEWQPRTDFAEAIITFDQYGRYSMSVDGWFFTGDFTVGGAPDQPRVTLDQSLQNFDLVEGTLQNWSEGEAVYVCGNVFERTSSPRPMD